MKTIIFLFLFLTSTVFSQSQLKIYYFKSLVDDDIEKLESISNSIKYDGKIILENFYNEDCSFRYNKKNGKGSKFDPVNRLYSMSDFSPVNTTILKEKEIDFIDNQDKNKIFIDFNNQLRWDLADQSKVNLIVDISDFKQNKNKLKRKLRKRLKRADLVNCLIYYGNSPVNYAYNSERLRDAYLNAKSKDDLSDLLINYRMQKDVSTPILRPIRRNSVENYRINIDTVGYYDAYEIRLTAFVDGEKVEFIDEKIDVTSESKISNMYFMNDSFDSSMNLFFDAEFLAKSLVSSVQSETMIDISIDDPTCNTCQFEYLYKHRYLLEIRGLASGYSEDDLWQGSKIFMFQCSK